jgi:hypothetical protein
VMPNPASDLIKITSASSSTVEIVDVHGRVVARREIVAGGHNIDVSSLAQGTYYVRFVMPLTTHVTTLTIRR